MKRIVSKCFFITVGLLSLSSVNAASTASGTFGVDKISSSLQNGWDDLLTTTDNILGYIIGLLYFISVILALWGGFKILTSAWDEDKVKDGKKVILYALLGLIVIFLASQLIKWIISIMSDPTIVV